MLNRLLRTRLAIRSAMILLIIVAIIGMVFLTAFRSLISGLEQDRQFAQITGLLETVESSASVAAFLEDNILAAEVVNGLLRNLVVSHAAIWAGDTELASASRAAEHSAQTPEAGESGNYRHVLYSPFDENDAIGHILLVPNQTEIRAVIGATSNFISMLLLAVMAAIGIGVVVVVLYLITRPIQNISRRLHKLRAETGEKLEFPWGNEGDEIGQLVRDVNSLIDNLVGLLHKEQDLRRYIEVEGEKFRTIFENAETGIFQVDYSGVLVSCNPAFKRLFGLPDIQTDPPPTLYGLLDVPAAAALKLLDKCVKAQHPVNVDFALGGKNGAPARWIHIVLNPLQDELLQGVANDITESKRSEQAAQTQAITDSLTGLSNRLGFERKLAETIERYRGKEDNHFALLMLDLDHFKPVNDTYGHPAGDQLLKQVADILRACVRKSDFVARLGGDEFALILDGTDDDKIIAAIAEKIIEQLRQPIDIGEDTRVQIGASLGIAIFNRHARELKDLIRKSDEALYDAKGAGRDTYRFYGKGG